MSGEQIAAGMVGAGLALLLMAVLATVAVAYVYQGAHAAREDAKRDAARARQYHRLSPAERRIWRASGEHPAVLLEETPFRPVEGTGRDGAGAWRRPAHA